MIKCSILIAVYNQEELIKKCLDSIPNRDDIEIIVVDDCSTDDTFNVVEKYPNVKLIKNKSNCGIGATRNVLLDAAHGEYIFFLDSDDYLFPDEFEKVLDNLWDCDIMENLCENNNHHSWYCHVYRGTFIKAIIAKSVPFRNVRCHEDTYWKKALNQKFPNIRKEKSDVLLYHYNNPRDGSLTALEKEKAWEELWLQFGDLN